MGRHKHWLALFLTIVLAALMRSGDSTSAQSQPISAKVSAELLQFLNSTDSQQRARVIVQLNSTVDVDSLLVTVGATVTRQLRTLNMRAVELPITSLAGLAASSEIRFISPDRPIASFGHIETTSGTAGVRVQKTTTLGLIQTTTVFDGRGIGIAIVDSGIDSHHQAFANDLGLSRVVASQDFTGEGRLDDPYGHGTHVASIAAGNSQISNGAYTGIAPGANLINLRILDSQGSGSTANLLAALDWIMTYRALYNIRVVNMSVGTPAIDSYVNDPVCQAVRQATDAGIVVVAAAGNMGKSDNGRKIYGRIHSPGNEPSAITVGAANTFGSDARLDDVVTTYSSRGPTRSFSTDGNGITHYDNLLKPDVVAPGNRIVGAASAGNLLLASHPGLDANVGTSPTRRMMYLSGSSMATPVVAGAAALMLQANPNLTPNLIKTILMYTAQPLAGFNMLEQGAGEINVDGAFRLAQQVRSDLSPSTPLGTPLLNGAAPTRQTTISGSSFSWGRGIVLNHTYATGTDLVTKYQRVYGRGWLLSDGVIEGSSTQAIDPDRFTSSVTLGSNLLTSNGTTLADGVPFFSFSWLLGDGIMLGDGILVGDGVMVGDGILVGDASLTSLNGDDTGCMR